MQIKPEIAKMRHIFSLIYLREILVDEEEKFTKIVTFWF